VFFFFSFLEFLRQHGGASTAKGPFFFDREFNNLYIYNKYREGRRRKSCGQQQTAETYENTHCTFGLLPLLLLLAGPPAVTTI
jgi:hypothetical protein